MEANAAQVFSTIFPAATALIQLAILLLTYQPSHYKPYRPKAKWRKKCGARWKAATAKLSLSAHYVAEWVGATIEKNFGKMRQTRRELTPSFIRRHQLYYWTTYNYKRRKVLQARWRCFWAVYAIIQPAQHTRICAVHPPRPPEAGRQPGRCHLILIRLTSWWITAAVRVSPMTSTITSRLPPQYI